MSLFTPATIARFINEGEAAFDSAHNCIVERLSLNIVSGTKEYTLPDTVQNIRRVTWKGYKLDPLTSRANRDYYSNPLSQGKPFWYLFNNIEANKLQFYPIPNETIASTASNLWGSEILNRVIIEYYITPNGTTYTIPAYFRRRLVKPYVLKACFAIEGQGQNLKNSNYHSKKFEKLSKLYSDLLDEINNKSRKLVLGNSINNSYGYPRDPVWPIDRFGIGVRTGE